MQHGNAHGHGHRQHRIVVIGAGYAGAIAAGRLARRLRREDVAITLVNAEPDFVERVRMHQLAVGQELRPRPFSEMFAGTGVRLRLAWRSGRSSGPARSARCSRVRGCGCGSQG
ncbi:tryptophan 7-halogenase [Streptomyces cavourensis]|uniref:tryptophan 7-halogenase n=1 Tax=Streptomyces cavourensis TaxID=67258 RepID=UPI0020C94C72|nr:tryptophan 7-halogenase [Streptomyces cavourensis]